MATRFQQFLLIILSFAFAQQVAAEEDGAIEINPIKVVEPDVTQRKVYEAKIDTEFFEVGVFTGFLSVEDFSTTPVNGIKASFHATEDFFLQANYGITTVGKTSFERLNGSDTNILKDEERDYKYYDFLVGYNVFPGETFMTQNLTFNSAFYLVAGAGNTEFAGDNSFTTVFGSGYRVLLNDFITWNMDYRDHMFETELTSGNKKQTHNLEFSTSLTFFF